MGQVIEHEHLLNDKQIKRIPIMFSVIIGLFFAILNNTLLNVAYSELSRTFNITETTVQWLSTAYMLIVGILVPISALLMQWLTTRQMFLGAMIFFTIGTLICSSAFIFEVILIGRIIQAMGAGFLFPITMNMVLLLYPPYERGKAMGMVSLVIMFAPALGPTLSGIIIDHLTWRWLFLSVLPFAIFSIVFASIHLKNVSKVTKPSFDILSIILSTISFGGLVFSFGSVGNAGWSSPTVYLSLLISIFSLIIFIMRQLRIEDPILQLRVFKYPMFSIGAVISVILMMTMYSMMIILPLFLQNSLLLSASVTGLILLPGGVMNGLLSPVVGRIFDRFGPVILTRCGMFLVLLVMITMTQVSLSTPSFIFVILHSLFMIGMAIVMTPAQTNGLNQLPSKYYPHGTAVISTLIQVSGAIGIALFLSIMAAGQSRYVGGSNDLSILQTPEAVVFGVKSAFIMGLVLAIIGLILTIFIKRTEG